MTEFHAFKPLDRPAIAPFAALSRESVKEFRLFRPSCFVCFAILFTLAALSFWFSSLAEEAGLQKNAAHHNEDVVALVEADMASLADMQKIMTLNPAAGFETLSETILHRAINRLETLHQPTLPAPFLNAVDALTAAMDAFHTGSHAALLTRDHVEGHPAEAPPSLAAILETLAVLDVQAEIHSNQVTRKAIQFEDLALLARFATIAMVALIIVVQFRRHRAHIRALENERVMMEQAHRHLNDVFDTTNSSLETMNTLFKKSADAARMTIFILNRDLVFSWIHNPRFGGNPEQIIGKSVYEVLPSPVLEKISAKQKDVIATGQAGSIEFDFVREGQHYFYSLYCDPLMEGDQVIGLIGLSQDITERHERDIRIEGLVTELIHRCQNMITVIHAMMRQTLRSSLSEHEFEEKFSGRLNALGRSLSFLTEHHWQPVCINDLVTMHLRSCEENDARRVKRTGAGVLLEPRLAEALGTALYELIDNAKRHGALSTKEGQVELVWSLNTQPDETSLLRLEWIEGSQTPLIPSFKQEGYGLMVLKTILPRISAGETEVQTRCGGLTWTISLPLVSTSDQAELNETIH